MMKTLAEFKREAKAGDIRLELVERFGSTDIQERLRGIRKIVSANTVGLKLMNDKGEKSTLDFEVASLMEYDGENLLIYRAGLRDMTAEECRVMEAWNEITRTAEYQRNAQNDAWTDGTITYYQKVKFFTERDMSYLMGHTTVRGLKLEYVKNDCGEYMIRDNRVKGEVILRYKIHR